MSVLVALSRRTKKKRLPRAGDGQNSSAAVLMVGPALTGASQPLPFHAAIQMSRPPAPPERFEAIYRLPSSGLRIGQPSLEAVFTELLEPGSDSALTGSLHSPYCAAPAAPAPASASAPHSHNCRFDGGRHHTSTRRILSSCSDARNAARCERCGRTAVRRP